MASVALNWPANPSAEAITKYEIFESLNGATFALKDYSVTNAYTMTGLPAGHYRWQVRAVNFVGVGAFSPIADGPDVPSQVGTVTVTVS